MKRLLNRGFLIFALLWSVTLEALGAQALIPVGQVIGLDLNSGCVTVAAYDDRITAARDAGVRIGDRILAVDGIEVDSAADVRRALEMSDGTVELALQRQNREMILLLEPEISPEGPRLGLHLRQGVTGIGTVTYFDPQTGLFGTLGHGVNDGKNTLLPMAGGSAYPAQVVSIQKGRPGHPGQLRGALDGSAPLGKLTDNTSQGVFGKTDRPWPGTALPVCGWESVRAGRATIRCTLDADGPREYSVEILKIYPKNRNDGRNLLLRVTDPALLSATGGIVQGMSGSPIIQDGKLVGAVTHVLVNDPTTGYGIFIENMLDAAA